MHYRICLIIIFLFLLCLPHNLFAVSAGKSIMWEGGGKGPVLFEGSEHEEEGLKCKDCHPVLFQMKQGSAKMTMKALNSGKFCGACHNGKTAFSTSDPDKCHECHQKIRKNKAVHKEKKHGKNEDNDEEDDD